MKRLNKIIIPPRNNLSKHEWVKLYYSQNEILKEIYDSGDFIDDELLYLFNNNTLKRLGFPMKRGGKRRKYKYRKLMTWHLFNIIEEIIDNTLHKEWINNNFFNRFVDFNQLKIGDENIYKIGE